MPEFLDQLDHLSMLDPQARRQRLAELRATSPTMAEELEEVLEEICTIGSHELFETNGGCSALASQIDKDNATGIEDPSTEQTATRLGVVPGYQIERLIGSGGQGCVYEARQLCPDRRVALKLLKSPQAASPDDIRLFEREIQALARLKHTSIATIFSSGATPDGTHYYAMELIDGAPLDRYARIPSIGLDEKLELFVQICDATAHAHAQGVIHRDLKPSNILIMRDGSPKVVDFGLARLSQEAYTDHTRSQQQSLIRGTLCYMSPEQAQGGSTIDARTDVYSLGVMLYELLSGRKPYDLRNVGLLEANRVICSSARPKPSSARPDLSQELDTITQKAMALDPAQRYQTVNELREDIERYLNHRPILARRASLAYNISKLVRRNYLTVILASLLLVTLTGSALQAWYYGNSIASQERLLASEHNAQRLLVALLYRSERKTTERLLKQLRSERDALRELKSLDHDQRELLNILEAVQVLDAPPAQLSSSLMDGIKEAVLHKVMGGATSDSSLSFPHIQPSTLPASVIKMKPPQAKSNSN